MDPKINIEEIEQYLEGTLQGDALKVFQERLLTDETLANRVELMKKIDLSISDEKALAVQKMTTGFGEDFFNQKSKAAIPRQIPFYRRPLTIAAGFLLLLTFAFLMWQQIDHGTVSNQELYASYYVPYQPSNANRGNLPKENIFNQGVQQYRAKNYSQSISSFQEFLSGNPNDMQAHFCLAHAYLNERPPALSQASDSFQKIIQDGKSILLPKSKWYLTLIYLKQEETANAKILLRELVNSADTKIATQAKELLGKIR